MQIILIPFISGFFGFGLVFFVLAITSHGIRIKGKTE